MWMAKRVTSGKFFNDYLNKEIYFFIFYFKPNFTENHG